MKHGHSLALFVGLPLAFAACSNGSQPPSPSSSSQPSAAASSSGLTTELIIGDWQIMIGGAFAPPHIGQAKYDAINERARANADMYLDVFETRILPGLEASAETSVSLSFVPSVLDALRPHAAEHVERLAPKVIDVYDRVIVRLESLAADAGSAARSEHAKDMLRLLRGARGAVLRLVPRAGDQAPSR
ncbi:hypothetical protein A7982_12421 [Minicystis rosea]|nr:hypothetical protein A7982_12421 [Minicystis rosea]